MPEEQRCLKTLLNQTIPIEEKADVLSEFVRKAEIVARNMGAGVLLGRRAAIRQLFEALPPSDKESNEQLRAQFEAIVKYNKSLKKKAVSESGARAAELRAVPPGTTVIIRNGNRREQVALLEVKRTRLICEYADGRQYSVPVQALVEVRHGKTMKRLSQTQRQQRELVRALASRGFKRVQAEILAGGTKLMRPLIDEYAAAKERIENAPVGLSGGYFGRSLGPCVLVNPQDQTLMKRIPSVMNDIARKIGKARVKKCVSLYAKASVRKELLNALR